MTDTTKQAEIIFHNCYTIVENYIMDDEDKSEAAKKLAVQDVKNKIHLLKEIQEKHHSDYYFDIEIEILEHEEILSKIIKM